LRLARILLEQDNLKEAAGLANVKQFDGFTSEYKELQGDIAMSNGDFGAARAAYEQALSELPGGSEYSDLMLLKLDHSIGVSKQ
jgi:predicted negative regulator of RcsB-dependent stress response